jgi:hypothetical protein
MKPEEKAKKQLPPTGYTRKTKDDFLRWLREKEALKKQASEGKNS